MYLGCFHIPPSFHRWLRRHPTAFLLLLIPLALFLYHASLTSRISAISKRPVAGSQLHEYNTNPANRNPDVLLVTSVFPRSNSPRQFISHDATRIAALIGQITTDIYVFTPAAFAPLLQASRGPGLTLFVNTTFEAPSEVPPLARHHMQRGAETLSKPYFLTAAARNMRGKGYKHAIWVDSDAFMSPHAFRRWPDTTSLEQALAKATQSADSIFMPIHYSPSQYFMVWRPTAGPLPGMMAETSIFGGSISAVGWYARAYYAYLSRWHDQDLHAVSDQEMANAILFMYHDRFSIVWPADYNAPAAQYPKSPIESALGYCGDQRRYSQFFLATEEEKREMNDIWQNEWTLKVWQSRRPCRDTRSLNAGDMLTAMFAQWTPPYGFMEIPQTPWT